MLALPQEQLDRLKTEASKTVEQLQQAKAKLEAAEKDLNSSRQSAYEDSQAANKEKQQMHNTITNLQVTSRWSSSDPSGFGSCNTVIVMFLLVHQAATNVLLSGCHCT